MGIQNTEYMLKFLFWHASHLSSLISLNECKTSRIVVFANDTRVLKRRYLVVQ
jgi:hypothetical protein